MISKTQIKKALSKFIEEDGVSELEYVKDNEEIGGLLFTQVDQKGGEGEGDEYFFVLKVEDVEKTQTAFIRFDGYYTSYDGTTFENNDFTVVEPKMVEVRQWASVR